MRTKRTHYILVNPLNYTVAVYVRTCAMGPQFKAAFAAFTAHCIDIPSAKYLEVAIVAAKVLEAHRTPKELPEMAQHPTLLREKPVVHALGYGINEGFRVMKPVSAAFFLAGELENAHIEDAGLHKKAIHAKLKEAKSAYGTKHGEQKFQGWHLQASVLMGSTSIPVALAEGASGFAGNAYGGQAYRPGGPAGPNRIPARRGGGGASGHYHPTYAHAGRGAGYHRGRGGFGRGGRGGEELDARVRRVLPQGVGVRPFTPRVPSQPATTATKMAMLSRTSLTHDNSESGQGRGRFPSPGGVTLYDK